MNDITADSQRQIKGKGKGKGIEEVNNATTEMDELTQRNAAPVEQSATAAKSMRHQAHDLMRVVDAFQLSEGGPPLLPR
jgi:methyl-accepting chemotaxis protein I, serine sensor receptor